MNEFSEEDSRERLTVETGDGSSTELLHDLVNDRYIEWKYEAHIYTRAGFKTSALYRSLPILNASGASIAKYLRSMGWQILPIEEGVSLVQAMHPSNWEVVPPEDRSCGWYKWFNDSGELVFSSFWKAFLGKVIECYSVIEGQANG